MNASVSPSGEMLAHPSIDAELISVDDPGSISISAGADQPPNSGIATAAVASANNATPAAGRRLLEVTFIIAIPQSIQGDAAGVERDRQMCDEGLPMML